VDEQGFDILTEITGIEIIAVGKSIRDMAPGRKLWRRQMA